MRNRKVCFKTRGKFVSIAFSSIANGIFYCGDKKTEKAAKINLKMGNFRKEKILWKLVVSEPENCFKKIITAKKIKISFTRKRH